MATVGYKLQLGYNSSPSSFLTIHHPKRIQIFFSKCVTRRLLLYQAVMNPAEEGAGNTMLKLVYDTRVSIRVSMKEGIKENSTVVLDIEELVHRSCPKPIVR